MNKNYHDIKKISFSEWRCFLKCPFEHFLTYIVKEPVPPTFSDILIFGSTIHKAIELGLQNNWDYPTPLKLFREARKSIIIEEVKRIEKNHEKLSSNYNKEKYFDKLEKFIADTKDEHEFYGTQLLEALNFKNNFPKEEWEIIGIEEELVQPLVNDIYFKGILDLRLRNKNTGKYLIIDWKSAGKKWDIDKKVKDDSFFAQVFLYQYFISKKFDVSMEDIELAYIVLAKDTFPIVELQKVSVKFDIEAGIRDFILPLQLDAIKIDEYKSKIKYTKKANLVEWEEKITKLKSMPKGMLINGYPPFVLCRSCIYNGLICNSDNSQKKYRSIF